MEILVSALNLSAIYALVAIGLSLSWAGLGFLNLAHGVTFAVAGYGAWWVAENLSPSGGAVLAGGILVGATGGAVIWLTVFLPLDGRENFDFRGIIATLALSYLGTNLLLESFGPRNRVVPEMFGTGQFELGGIIITADRSGTIVTAVGLLAVVTLAMQGTRAGLAVRALTQSPEGAKLVGINRRTTALAVLVASGCLVGAAAAMLSQTFYVSPNAGYVPLIKGLIVALLGGFGSIPGTIIAALLVGGVEALTLAYLGGHYVFTTLFGLIVIVLMTRPRGIAGLLETTRA